MFVTSHHSGDVERAPYVELPTTRLSGRRIGAAMYCRRQSWWTTATAIWAMRPAWQEIDWTALERFRVEVSFYAPGGE